MKELNEKNSQNSPNTELDEIDLREIFNVLWEGKKIIILITSAIAIFSIVYSLMLTDYYRSESILLSADSQTSSSMSEFSGLASLAGIGLPGSSGDSVYEMIAIIKSREFVKHLMTFEGVVPSLMAPKTFDPSTGRLIFDSEDYTEETKEWIRSPINNNIEPSYLEVHEAYLGSLSVTQDKETRFISITFEHISPLFAKEFVSLVINEANSLKREKDILTSSKALTYLKEELSKTSLIEIKGSINQLIESQLETMMMAKVKDEYSLVIIEPPFVPEKKSKPFRSIIVIAFTFVGGLLSLFFVLVRHFYIFGQNTKLN